MVVYLYRWKLKPGKEDQFKNAWELVTRELREKCNSRGSRLHIGDDGIYYGYAQWPDHQTRDNAGLRSEAVETARSQMKDAIAESLPDIVLNPLADYLVK